MLSYITTHSKFAPNVLDVPSRCEPSNEERVSAWHYHHLGRHTVLDGKPKTISKPAKTKCFKLIVYIHYLTHI